MRKCIISTTGSGTLKEHRLENYFDIYTFIVDVNKYRKRQELNKTQFADLCDLTPATIASALKRRYNPNLCTMIILANVADLSLDNYRKDPDHGYVKQRMVEVKRRSHASSTTWDKVLRGVQPS